MIWLTLSIAAMIGLLGVAMTAIALPGLWFIAACSAVIALVHPSALGWGTVITLFVFAVIGEAVDFIASALGVKRMGGTRSGAWGSVIGTMLGAILGSFVVPIIGSIIGGVLGAGLGAIVGERSIAKRTWRESARSGGGAAIGRLISLVCKLMLAGAGAGLLVSMITYNALT